MATIKFLYRSSKDEACLTLRLSYTIKGTTKRAESSTTILVGKKYWDKELFSNAKNQAQQHKQDKIKGDIDSLKSKVWKVFYETPITDINQSWLKNIVENHYFPKKEIKYPDNILEYFDIFIAEKKALGKAKNTIENLTSAKNHLQVYEKTLKAPILIKDVGADFKMRYKVFCEDAHKYSFGTIMNDLAIIKSVCIHAKDNEVETHKKLKKRIDFEPEVNPEDVDKVYLSFSDLEKITNLSSKKIGNELDAAKDWLILSCYLGQRVSDFLKLTEKAIRFEEGERVVELIQKKTKKKIAIPVLPEIAEILDKRNGEFPPYMAYHRYNDNIKLVCKKAKLNELVYTGKVEDGRKVIKNYKKWEVVTSHIGRISFATNHYGDWPTPFIMNVTGHSKEKTFLSYIGKDGKDMALDILRFIKKKK